MGLFSPNYEKPGVGVDKDAPQKRRFFLFFDVFFRKLWKLMALNMLYSLFCFVYFIFLYNFAPLVNQGLITGLTGVSANDPNFAYYMVSFRVFFAILIILLWGFGPISAGYTYILRNYAREEHAWILSDFFGKMKSNFKQGALVLIVDIVLIFIGSYSINFYAMEYAKTNSLVFLVGQYVMILLFIVYTLMHQYIYNIMVTFDVKLKDLFKNSFVLAMGKLPINVTLTLLSIVIIYLAFCLGFIVGLSLSAVILIVLCDFIIYFYTSNVIAKIISSKKTEDNVSIFND